MSNEWQPNGLTVLEFKRSVKLERSIERSVLLLSVIINVILGLMYMAMSC